MKGTPSAQAMSGLAMAQKDAGVQAFSWLED